MNTFQKAIRELSDSFSSSRRPNGNTYIILKENSLEWVKKAVREAHFERLPDDWIYQKCWDIASNLKENFHNWEDVYDLESVADSNYNDLTAWLASYSSNLEYCDNAIKQFIGRNYTISMWEIIQRGQEIQISEIFNVLLKAIKKRAKKL